MKKCSYHTATINRGSGNAYPNFKCAINDVAEKESSEEKKAAETEEELSTTKELPVPENYIQDSLKTEEELSTTKELPVPENYIQDSLKKESSEEKKAAEEIEKEKKEAEPRYFKEIGFPDIVESRADAEKDRKKINFLDKLANTLTKIDVPTKNALKYSFQKENVTVKAYGNEDNEARKFTLPAATKKIFLHYERGSIFCERKTIRGSSSKGACDYRNFGTNDGKIFVVLKKTTGSEEESEIMASEDQDVNADDLVFEGNFGKGDYEVWFNEHRYDTENPSNTATTFLTVRVPGEPAAELPEEYVAVDPIPEEEESSVPEEIESPREPAAELPEEYVAVDPIPEEMESPIPEEMESPIPEEMESPKPPTEGLPEKNAAEAEGPVWKG